jgi:thiamine biosynthesis lipoprotein
VNRIASATFPALGTTAGVFITDPHSLPAARRLLDEELAVIDRSCSRFRADSELSRINAAAGRPVTVSEHFLEALEVALRAARVTGGAVDPTVGRALRAVGYDRDFASISANRTRPASGAVVAGWQTVHVDKHDRSVRVARGVELDLGATAKALATDRAAMRIERELHTGVLINLGGDLAVAGAAPPGGWRIRVSDDHRDRTAADGETVSITAGGLATSSTTVRQWAAGAATANLIVDPRLGTSAAVVWRTASVAAASCVDANTASTAAIIRGDEASAWLDELGLPGRLVRRDGRVLRVGGWPRRSG